MELDAAPREALVASEVLRVNFQNEFIEGFPVVDRCGVNIIGSSWVSISNLVHGHIFACVSASWLGGS